MSEPGGAAGGAPKRQRAHQRSALELPVSIITTSGATVGGLFLAFDTRDVSAGGAFLKSASLLEVGEELQLELKLGGGRTVRAKARVVRVERGTPSGMGVVFSSLDDKDLQALKQLLVGRS